MNPLSYSLCCETVTLYRQQGETVLRQVIPNCHMRAQHSTPAEPYGKSMEKRFLLMIPEDVPLCCGDRIYRGIGPEAVDWQSFVPATVQELYEVSFAKPCFWEGEFAHWEAGNRKEHL